MHLRLSLGFRFCLLSSRLAQQRFSSDLKLSSWRRTFEGAGVVELTFWSQLPTWRRKTFEGGGWEGECLVELTLQGATEGEPAQDVEGEMKNAQFLGGKCKEKMDDSDRGGEVCQFCGGGKEWSKVEWVATREKVEFIWVGKVGRREESLVKCDMRWRLF